MKKDRLELNWKYEVPKKALNRPRVEDCLNYYDEEVSPRENGVIQTAILEKDDKFFTFTVWAGKYHSTVVIKRETFNSYGFIYDTKGKYFNLDFILNNRHQSIGGDFTMFWFNDDMPNNSTNNEFYFEQCDRALKDFFFGD